VGLDRAETGIPLGVRTQSDEVPFVRESEERKITMTKSMYRKYTKTDFDDVPCPHCDKHQIKWDQMLSYAESFDTDEEPSMEPSVNYALLHAWAAAWEHRRALQARLKDAEERLAHLGPGREFISRWSGSKFLAAVGLNEEQVLSGYGEVWRVEHRPIGFDHESELIVWVDVGDGEGFREYDQESMDAFMEARRVKDEAADL
jgi:hypothetical protein